MLNDSEISLLKLVAESLRGNKNNRLARKVRTLISRVKKKECTKEECIRESETKAAAETELRQKAAEKFERGAKEHNEDWPKVDHVGELTDELLDAFNYLRGAGKYNRPTSVDAIRELILEAYVLAKKLRRSLK